MAFGSVVFTNRGKVLQSKAQAGKPLKFTKLAIGDGELGGQSVLELTALKNKKMDIPISSIKVLTGGVASVGGTFTNQALATGFWWRELGLFAEDPDLGEILYCYGNAGALAEYIPSSGGNEILEKRVDIEAIVGNATNVSAVINGSLIYATLEDIDNHNQSEQAHPFLSQQIKTCLVEIEEVKQDVAGLDVSWGGISNKPTTFPPTQHSHAQGDLPQNLNADTLDGKHATYFASAAEVSKGADVTQCTLSSVINNKISSGLYTGYFNFSSCTDAPFSNAWGCCCYYRLCNDGRVHVSAIKSYLTQPYVVQYMNGGTINASEWTLQATTAITDALQAELNTMKVHSHSASSIGEGTMVGVVTAQSNALYTTRQVRNAVLSTSSPSGGYSGDTWFTYV